LLRNWLAGSKTVVSISWDATVHKMQNRQGIQKLDLVEEESEMNRNEYKALGLLRRRVKEMRASG